MKLIFEVTLPNVQQLSARDVYDPEETLRRLGDAVKVELDKIHVRVFAPSCFGGQPIGDPAPRYSSIGYQDIVVSARLIGVGV